MKVATFLWKEALALTATWTEIPPVKHFPARKLHLLNNVLAQCEFANTGTLGAQSCLTFQHGCSHNTALSYENKDSLTLRRPLTVTVPSPQDGWSGDWTGLSPKTRASIQGPLPWKHSGKSPMWVRDVLLAVDEPRDGATCLGRCQVWGSIGHAKKGFCSFSLPVTSLQAHRTLRDKEGRWHSSIGIANMYSTGSSLFFLPPSTLQS